MLVQMIEPRESGPSAIVQWFASNLYLIPGGELSTKVDAFAFQWARHHRDADGMRFAHRRQVTTTCFQCFRMNLTPSTIF